MDRELIAYFDERFRELREESGQQFRQLGERFDKVEQRLDKVEQRLGKVVERLDKVEQRLEEVDQRVGRLEIRVDQLSERVDQLAGTVHETQILVEDLRGKIELVAEGVAGANERLETSRDESRQDTNELRNLFTFPVKKLGRRVQVVEERTTRHTRQVAALRRRAEKPRSRPS